MVQLAALGLQNPQIDTLGAFREGAATAAGIDEAKRQAAEKSLQLVGAASMHALGGNIDGQADPAKFEEGLNMLQDMGINVEKFRGKPQMASIAARASMSALQQLQLAKDDRDFEFLMQKFGQAVSESDRQFGLDRETLDFNKSKALAGDLPSGYQRSETGLAPIPGGPADPSNPLNTRKVTGPSMSVTAQKELFEADEAISSGQAVLSALDRAMELNDKAYSGPMADQRGYAGSIVGMEGGVATEELKNLITTQALDQLKATFGSMPTEGERKILLEIQGSVNQAPEVRKRIYERAKQMAARRMEFSKQKAGRLRSGEYFSEGPGGSGVGFSDAPEGAEEQLGGEVDAEVSTQEQYDALPSGSEFMSGGQRYRKP